MILKLLPSLRARCLPDGRIVLTKKFIAGVNEFQKVWAGPVTVYMLASEHLTLQLDEGSVWPKDLSFDIEVLSLADATRAITADRSAVVLLSLDDFRQSGLGALCTQSGIASAYISEYSLATRKQIIDVTTANPLKRIRRKFWESKQERKRVAAVASATGLQCNGTPTYDAYRDLCPETILFFDTRVTENLLATEEEVLRRLSRLTGPRRLELVFSGRLSPMKGCLDLLEVAKELRRMNMNFHLSICGDGESKQALSQTIEVEQLSQHVSLNGILEFESELMPFVRADIDLFICCHPQGDPSCTYLETMSCGVPIAGYANEAFEGMVRSSGVGWTVPMNRPDELARMVLDIQRTPEALRENSLGALAFAKGHTFSRTVSRRIGHLRAIGATSGKRITEPLTRALQHRAASAR